MRHIVRFIGLILLAAGFIGIVIDGTRSMANTTVLFSSLSDVSNMLFPAAIDTLHDSVTAQAPDWLWDKVCLVILRLPASVAGMVFGLLLIRLCERKPSNSLPGVPPLR